MADSSKSLTGFSPRVDLHSPLVVASAVLMVLWILGNVMTGEAFARKRKSAPVVPPDLRIVSVVIAPDEYSAGTGTLDFIVEVELPTKMETPALLEVTSLIGSPSMRSMRFLTSRQSVEEIVAISAASRSDDETKRRVEVTLSWDGMDQARELVSAGGYDYEIRAKLLSVGESGVRTQMVSWPKRGTVTVK